MLLIKRIKFIFLLVVALWKAVKGVQRFARYYNTNYRAPR